MGEAVPRYVELKAGAPDDPDGLRTATVLSAYFHAEQMKAFRRLLWRWLAIAAAIWFIVTFATSLFSRGTMLTGLAVLGALACWGAFVERSAGKRLGALIADLPDHRL